MSDLALTILEIFAEGQARVRPPKLKRKWWWKPNTQLCGRYAQFSTPAEHTQEHPEYKHWCCVCRQARRQAAT